jgi:hypothetical protein
MKMKALTICQPYAWGIVPGPKDVENRGWRLHHRGWLAIHAGLSTEWLHTCHVPGKPGLFLNDGTQVPDNELVFGAVIGLAKVVNCLEVDDPRLRGNKFAEGPYCIMLDERKPLLKPFYCTGHQGLWDVDIPDEYITGSPSAVCSPARSAAIAAAHKPANANKPANAGGCQLVDLPGGGRAFVCRRGAR